MDNLRKFLQGDQPHLVGTVIGFTKRVTKYFDIKDNKTKVLHDSILIYFDHTSGCITRHLINRGLINSNYNLIINNKIKIPTIYGKTLNISAAEREDLSKLIQNCLVNFDYNYNNICKKLIDLILSYTKSSNLELKKGFKNYIPVFNLLLDLTNRDSLTNMQIIMSKNFIRNNYRGTIFTGKLDSGFYSKFMDYIIPTYLTGYPNSINGPLYTTSIINWLECLDELNLKSIAAIENNHIGDNVFHNFNNKKLLNKTNLILDPLINIKEIENPIIRIPKVFYSSTNINHFNKILSLYNPNIKFKIEPNTISNSPDSIKMLKTMINGNIFFTENELEKRIIHFNYLMKKKINKMN